VAANYAAGDRSLGDAARSAMAAYVADHDRQRQRHGIHRYDLADYGFDPAAIATRFAPYAARYAIPRAR
jgi:hypothetical protein